MKKYFYLRALIFIAIFIIIFIILSNVQLGAFSLVQKMIGNENPLGASGHTLERYREIENVSNVDILFVGSSHAYKGFDTRIFQMKGLKVFNMGSNSQTPLNSYYLLKKYAAHLNPKLVILELFPLMLESDGLESSYDLVLNLPISSEMFQMSLAVKNPHAMTALFAAWFGRLSHPLDKVIQENTPNWQCVPEGYCGFIGPSGNQINLAQFYKDPFGTKMNPAQLNYVRKITTALQERGSQVIWVVNPLPKEFLLQDKNYASNAEQVAQLARELHVDFIDFNNILNLDSQKYFVDASHLNQTGINLLNKVLLEKIQGMEIFH